jgi:hypothetical protein
MASDDTEKCLSLLKKAIRTSFPVLPPPAREEITSHECEEGLAIRAAFVGKTWDSLQPHEIEERFDSLPLLSPAAFYYYFPAYLLYSLDHFDDDSLVCQFTIYALKPDEDEAKYHDWWQALFELCTEEQCRVMEAFIDLVLQSQALDWYHPHLQGAKERLRSYYKWPGAPGSPVFG